MSREGSPEVIEALDIVSHAWRGGDRIEPLRFDRSALASVGSRLADLGIAEPVSVSTEGSEAIPKSWSNAYDSRVDLSSMSGAQYDKIGRLSAALNCTGTLIGRRLVLTNAHCILNSSGNYVAGTFQADVRDSTEPYGEQDVLAAWWGGNYSGCTNWATCVPEDWAILLLEDNFPSGHPGWHGYAYSSTESNYDTYYADKRVHGYAGCGSGAPSGCTSPRLYGQTFDCSIGDFRYPFSNGYNSTFSHGCDTNAGQSGSPVLDIGHGWVVGIHSTSMCNPTTCANESNSDRERNPNLAKRLDSYIVNLISNLRATYP